MDGEKYVWTNRRRLSSQQPFENNGDVKVEDVKSLKELKAKYSQCVEERKLPLILYYGTDRIIREVPQRGHIKNFQVTDALRNCLINVNILEIFMIGLRQKKILNFGDSERIQNIKILN